MRVRFPSTVESPCRTRPAPTRRRTRVEVERLERDEALEGNLLIRPGRLMIPRRGGPGSVAAARVLHAAGPPDAPVSVLNVEPRHDAHLGPVLEALEGRQVEVRNFQAGTVLNAVLDEVKLGYSVVGLGTRDDVGPEGLLSLVVDEVLAECPVPTVIVRARRWASQPNRRWASQANNVVRTGSCP